MINIVMPMAGLGSRFTGYAEPKPLIRIHGIPMGVIAACNLIPKCEHRFIFIFQQEHVIEWKIDQVFREYFPDSVIIPIDGITEGTVCTILKAKEFINNHDQLMIANCDQWIDFDVNEYLRLFDKGEIMLMTVKTSNPARSFVKFEKGKPVKFIEKDVVSDVGIVGIHNARWGNRWVESAELMVKRGVRSKGEFFVATVFNYLDFEDIKLPMYDTVHFLGIPEEVEKFKKLKVSEKVRQYGKHNTADL